MLHGNTSRLLLRVLRLHDGLVELGGELFTRPLAEGLLDETARISARRAGEPFGGYGRFAFGVDGDLDRSAHAAPPLTWMVNLIEPSARVCSVH
jgi:hypothetical protein